MIVEENVSLASRTTFKVGGSARFFIQARGEQDIKDAIVFARERHLPLFVLGAGSNVLVPDTALNAVVVQVVIQDVKVHVDTGYITVDAGAGVSWDDIVDDIGEVGGWGIENLAGIPGCLGGAVVQNIGAYGAELSSVFVDAEGIDVATGLKRRVACHEAQFSYRTSYFKTHPNFIITRVVLRLARSAAPNLVYADLAQAQAEGVSLGTPTEIARVVRSIRAQKFPPSNAEEGTAGSFFKNPIVSESYARELKKQFPALPVYPQDTGDVKISLAWILDHVLGFKGYTKGSVRLYEKQPLVIVASPGARAEEINLFAEEIATRVWQEIHIRIEREVEMFGTYK